MLYLSPPIKKGQKMAFHNVGKDTCFFLKNSKEIFRIWQEV